MIFVAWMSMFVCALLWSSWLGWCRPGFCLHQGKVKWATWYPRCALCVSAEGMELHLQGSSGGNLWLLNSQPPFQHSRMDKCQPSDPSPFSPGVPLPSYKSPASLPTRPDSIPRDPRGWLSSSGPFQISEHDATAPGPVSVICSLHSYSACCTCQVL